MWQCSRVRNVWSQFREYLSALIRKRFSLKVKDKVCRSYVNIWQ